MKVDGYKKKFVYLFFESFEIETGDCLEISSVNFSRKFCGSPGEIPSGYWFDESAIVRIHTDDIRTRSGLGFLAYWGFFNNKTMEEPLFNDFMTSLMPMSGKILKNCTWQKMVKLHIGDVDLIYGNIEGRKQKPFQPDLPDGSWRLETDECVTLTGPAGRGFPCIFPFTLQDPIRTYIGCAEDDVGMWCSTKVIIV